MKEAAIMVKRKLEKATKLPSSFQQRMHDIAESVREFQRAKAGLPLEDDQYNGLVNIKDIRERTRLDAMQVYEHSYMRLSALAYEELESFNDVADMEDTYFIALDGEQRKEAILLKQRGETPQNVVSIGVPTVETKPPEEKKKGWFRR